LLRTEEPTEQATALLEDLRGKVAQAVTDSRAKLVAHETASIAKK